MNTPTHCEMCNKQLAAPELFPLELVPGALLKLIEQDNANLDMQGFICLNDLEHYQLLRSRELLQGDATELNEAEEEVLSNIKSNQITAGNINLKHRKSLTFSQRMADKISDFGGSWEFIGIFCILLFIWISINSWLFLTQPYDPYPYILLNLVLACITALQAPIIMMSQNRQAQKDRLTAENDYKVNLKSELLILQLTAKTDHLMKKQWLRTLESQQIQIESSQSLIMIQQSQIQLANTLNDIQKKLETK